MLGLNASRHAKNLRSAPSQEKREEQRGFVSEIEQQNKAAVQAGFDNWKAGKDSIYDLLAPDVEWTIAGASPAAGTYHSRKQFLDKVIGPFNARVSKPLSPTIPGMYAEGDMVVVHWEGVATAKDGRPYENTYAWFLQIAN